MRGLGEKHRRFGRGLSAAAAAALLLGVATDARAAVYDYTGGLLSFTAPVTGTYDITAFGAQGGKAENCSTGPCTIAGSGGLGAEISGDVRLTAGETLTLLVGGQGNPGIGGGGGGGGGSFVVLGTSPGYTALVVAGGGGGGGRIVQSGAGGLAGNGGNSQGGAGSKDGNGGAGGGGFTSQGGDASGGGFTGYGGGTFPGAGGAGGFGSGSGGYGGGGGAGLNGGGGGGGYSGGAGGQGTKIGADGGGGGGSYLDASVKQLVALSGVRSGNGEIDITFAPGPTPGAGLADLAALALAGLYARTRRA